jgi:hypothetical protein
MCIVVERDNEENLKQKTTSLIKKESYIEIQACIIQKFMRENKHLYPKKNRYWI